MAAGNWYSNAGIGDANQSLITKSIDVALHASDKNGDAAMSPVMQTILARDEGLSNLLGARGASFSFADIGQAVAAATAEGTAAGATNFDESSVTLTPARKEFVRVLSDYGRSLSDSLLQGELSPSAMATLVYEGVRVWQNTLLEDIAALASSATYEAGVTGTALTWQAMHHMSIDHRDRGDTGLLHVALTAKGVKDLADDAISLGGAVQMSQQVQQFLNGGGTGALIGTFFGNQMIYLSSTPDADGSDTLGLAFSANGIHTKHQRVPLPPEAMTLVDAGFFRQELRRPGGAVSNVSTDMYLSAGIRQAAGLTAIRYKTAA